MSYSPGEICLFPYNFEPAGFMRCEGQQLPVGEFKELFAAVGNKFGGDGKEEFALPDYRGAGPRSKHRADRREVLVEVPYHIFVSAALAESNQIDVEPYQGQVTLHASAPEGGGRGSAPCDGRRLEIRQHTALFSLLYTRFGGDGQQNFALPSLAGQAPPGSHYRLAVEGTYPTRDTLRGFGSWLAGEIRLFPYEYAPGAWHECDGTAFGLSQNQMLAALLQIDRFGGDMTSYFLLPDLRDAAPEGLKYCIATDGMFPLRAER